MRVPIVSLLAATAFALPGCTQPPTQPQPAEQQAQPAAPVRSSGVVVAITREYNAITIQHEPIPEYGMDAMTMEFTVDEASKLDGIDVGDEVSFELSGPLDIQSIATADNN